MQNAILRGCLFVTVLPSAAAEALSIQVAAVGRLDLPLSTQMIPGLRDVAKPSLRTAAGPIRQEPPPTCLANAKLYSSATLLAARIMFTRLCAAAARTRAYG
jgi:hypothetical protein